MPYNRDPLRRGEVFGAPRRVSNPGESMHDRLLPSYVHKDDDDLMTSLHWLLLMNEWMLPSAPNGFGRERYILGPTLQRNVIWIQRKEWFFLEHPHIKEDNVFVTTKFAFPVWAKKNFNKSNNGQAGPTEARCAIIGMHVIWLDRDNVERPFVLPDLSINTLGYDAPIENSSSDHSPLKLSDGDNQALPSHDSQQSLGAQSTESWGCIEPPSSDDWEFIEKHEAQDSAKGLEPAENDSTSSFEMI